MDYFEEEHDDVIAANAEMTGVVLSSGLVPVEVLNRCIRSIDKRRLKGEKPPYLLSILTEEGHLSTRQKKALEKAADRNKRDKKLSVYKIPGYECLKELGSGGLGAVILARQISMRRLVAVKVLHDKWGNDEEFRSRFLLEARVVGRLSHQNLIQVYDVGKGQNHYYFSMEFVDGSTLEHVIKDQGALSHDRALSITTQVTQALDYISTFDIVHRDIKPSNIIINQNGVVKLGDFGFLYSKHEDSLQQEGYVIGTPDYISPEQASGGAVDIRSDIYSLGVCLYQMLTGILPYEGSASSVMLKHVLGDLPDRSPSATKNIPADIYSLICKMMANEPSERYANTTELLDDLRLIEAAMIMRRSGKHNDSLPKVEMHELPSSSISPDLFEALQTQVKWMFTGCVVLSIIVVIETFFLLWK